MKAIRIRGPKEARYEDIPMLQPGPDDVLIKIKAVAICATDVELYDGRSLRCVSNLSHA